MIGLRIEFIWELDQKMIQRMWNNRELEETQSQGDFIAPKQKKTSKFYTYREEHVNNAHHETEYEKPKNNPIS